MSEQPTESYKPVPYDEQVGWGSPDFNERAERILGKVTFALVKLSVVLLVIGLEVIVLIAVARLLIK